MKATGLKLAFGTEVIYDNAEFQINGNVKLGIVGVNGAGKTTLFKVILGSQELDDGFISLSDARIGHLPQEIEFENLDKTVWGYIYEGRPIEALENELTQIYTQLSLGSKEEAKLLKKAGKIQDTLDILNQYGAEDDLLELIENMKIDDVLLNMRLKDLSGGQKSKVAFARLLFSNSDVLLLDEPTNHLDASFKDYVTNYLKNYHGEALIISHDIDFLNEVVDKIMFINKVTHKISIYDGNYSDFKRAYAREMVAKENRIIEQEREIAKLEEIVKRAEQASATNHNLKRLGASRKIQLDKKLSELETRERTYKRVSIKIEPKRRSGNIPLEVSNLSFSYPNKEELYDNLSFTLAKNEKFLIVGENGIGKSTLLKLIMGILKPNTGSINFSGNTDIAYYAQELEILDDKKSILENISSNAYSEREQRSMLGNFLFQGDDVFKSVKVLSPGEKARVALCKTLMKRANLIILDEPTNHFDPETQELIGENFKDYTGTLILVSHNPSFVKSIGITRMLVLPDGIIREFSEELLNYYYYLNTDLV